MGRKTKKTTEAGQSSSEGSQVSTAAKGGAGAGGKSYPSTDESPRTDSQKEKQQKKQKQSAAVTGGGQESGKTKRKTNGRDSSEEAKKQAAKQKAKSSRGGASAKSKVAKDGCCSLFCCVAVLSVLVAIVAVAGYAGYMAYPDESMRFIESADVELRQLYRSVRDVASKKLDEVLIAVGQKTPDKTEPVPSSTEEDDYRRKEESKEEEDEAAEETVIGEREPEDEADEEIVVREHVPEDEADEEIVVREHVPEDEADEEIVVREQLPEDEADEEIVVKAHVPEDEGDKERMVREHAPEVHEEKKQAEEKTKVPMESRVDETVEGTDVRSEVGVVEEESLEKDSEEERVNEERINETVDEQMTEEEVVEDDAEQSNESKDEEVKHWEMEQEERVKEDTGSSDEELKESHEEQAKESKDEEVKHWETEQEERVKGDTGSVDEELKESHEEQAKESKDEELKESYESPAAESIRVEEPRKDNDDEAQVIPEQVEKRTEEVPVVNEHDVPKQEVPEPEVVHLEASEPQVPRVVVPVEPVLESEVHPVEEVVLDVAEENQAEEHLGKEAQVESEAPVASEHLGETVQSEERVKKEEPEQPKAFGGSDVVETEASDRGLEHSAREEDVKEMKQPVVEEIRADIPASEGVPVDAGTGEEQVLQPIPPVVGTGSQEHQPADEVEAPSVVQPSTQSAQTQQSAESHPQEDAGHRQHEERFEPREPAVAENTAAETSDEKSAEEELERQLDYLDGVVNTAPREAIEMYTHILDVVPENPRAVIGKAYALGVAANVEQSDVALEQSISEYLKVFSLPSVPKPLMLAAARACAEKQTLRGWGNSAAQTLKSLVAMYPDDLELYNELGQKYVLNGAYEEARATFKEILNKNPTDAFAMLYLGFIMKLVDKDLDQSLDLMKTGLLTVPVTDLKFYMELGESLTRAGRHNEAHEVYKLAVDRKLLKSVWQRSWYNVDGLRSRARWTPKQTNNLISLQMLEDFWMVIRDEAMDILVNKSEMFQPDNRDIIDSGEMKHVKLFVNGRKMTENCDAAVKTCSLLEAFSDATECSQCEVKFSMMQPGLHTRPHCGPTNCRLTAQLPLYVDPQTRFRVADKTRPYVLGEFLIFDDSFEQELWVASKTFQLLLTVEMWHPDLSFELRKTLGPL